MTLTEVGNVEAVEVIIHPLMSDIVVYLKKQ